MKLTQRIVVAFYKKKFSALALLSKKRAAKAAFKLFCTPYTSKSKRGLLAVAPGGERIKWKLNGETVIGHLWPALKNKQDKTILICHGFDSSSARFNKYIEALANYGYDVVAFDAPAHGLSQGNTIDVLLYADLIERILKHYQPVYGIICHSFGGLATVLALERFSNPASDKLVMVSPSTETMSAIDQFIQFLGLNGEVKNHFYQLIETLSSRHPSWFSVARAIEQLSINTLWIHDKNDKVTPFSDVAPVLQKAPPHIKFNITEGLGHSPYTNEKVMENIICFLQPTSL